MKELFNKIKNNKNYLGFVIVLGVSLLSVIISSFWDVFIPFSCICFGIASVYGAYLLLLHYIKIKNRHLDEFLQDEGQLKRKKVKFLESESKINNILLIGLFFIMGLILIYYGISSFVV